MLLSSKSLKTTNQVERYLIKRKCAVTVFVDIDISQSNEIYCFVAVVGLKVYILLQLFVVFTYTQMSSNI